MPLADVLQLVADVSDGLADQTAATNYNTDLVQLIGTDPDGTLVNINTPSITSPPVAPFTFNAPSGAITTLAVLYEDLQLSYSNISENTLFDPFWQGTRGEPRVWFQESVPRHTINVSPNPVRPVTGAALPLDPTATNPGSGTFTVLYTESRTDVHPEEELAVALEITCREFSRDSDHTDRTLAQACRTLAGALFQMIDLAVTDHEPAYAKSIEEQG